MTDLAFCTRPMCARSWRFLTSRMGPERNFISYMTQHSNTCELKRPWDTNPMAPLSPPCLSSKWMLILCWSGSATVRNLQTSLTISSYLASLIYVLRCFDPGYLMGSFSLRWWPVWILSRIPITWMLEWWVCFPCSSRPFATVIIGRYAHMALVISCFAGQPSQQ